jgi:hypothetical protein
MFDDKNITKEKVKTLLYSVRNEFDNELDFDYESDYKEDFTNNDLNMMIELLDRFLHKVNLVIDDELEDYAESEEE